ncbi:hypothetical protein B0A55_05597 [Friedmanniomyces simplex]|uniref:Heme oxygenase-like protein n=1 Tax=Friedmanniomyces simplex TaxID=329884 RepID=A0A4U0XJZ8_9PEZI|nr:hypothetical protein B0A55_05597 [Friedmanniomyces simplex]
MPRPPDTYSHSQANAVQFSLIDSDNKGETVQCKHCKQWTGNVKTLARKKDHLLKCTHYLAWRAAGNGQDLAPAAPYNKRDSSHLEDDNYESPYAGVGEASAGPSYTPAMTRNRHYDATKSFDEFWDDSASQKVEHLASCREFLSSTEGQQALANGDLMLTPAEVKPGGSDIWRGSAPNPNLAGVIHRRGPNKPRQSTSATQPPAARPAAAKPSLAGHLVTKLSAALTDATQKAFLSHAGCGTLSAAALNQWLAQEIHISRALVPFVGSLIGKVRIPETSNLTSDPTYRAIDLLCSAVNNMKKELEFLESTKRKYDLRVDLEEPHPATQGFIDLLASASAPQSSLLEGLVVLWATEHCFCVSFQYAGNFMSTMPASSSYQLPSYLNPAASNSNMYSTTEKNADTPHITALHDAFIQNWTSANFVRFVSACKSIVDEVANAQTTGNGKTEMTACERRFRQAIAMWGQIWPEVDGMGEEEEPADANANGAGEKPIEIDDDADAEGAADSPYGGTGLGAIDAHNRESVSAQ